MSFDVVLRQAERPNALSVGWSARGFETVPAYESAVASKDPHAMAYRIIQTTTANHIELHCDASDEILVTEPIEDLRLKKNVERPIGIAIRTSRVATASNVAQISGIKRKKINLKQKEPVITMSTDHGKISLLLFRGGYCGFSNPDQTIEYYWQLRYLERAIGQKGPAKFKDAILRRAPTGQLSTMSGTYIPNQGKDAESSREAAEEQLQSLDGSTGDQDLGRLLLRADLNQFDKDLALISLVAVLIRVIQAEVSHSLRCTSHRVRVLTTKEKRDKFGTGFINALTIGET